VVLDDLSAHKVEGVYEESKRGRTAHLLAAVLVRPESD
jgi:hypothetical protein